MDTSLTKIGPKSKYRKRAKEIDKTAAPLQGENFRYGTIIL